MTAAPALFVLLVASQAPSEAPAPQLPEMQGRIVALESKVRALESNEDKLVRRYVRGIDNVTILLLLMVAAFCALWAQQNGRNAVGWFFLGAFLAPIGLICVLFANHNDKAAAAKREPAKEPPPS